MAENEQVVNLSIYDEMAAKHNAAYAAFKAMYETRTPPPLRDTVKRENVWSLVALVVMVIASVIVSGSRTVDEFGGGVVGYAAFCMVELGIVAYAFIRTRTDYDEARHASVKALVNRGMWLAFGVGVGANLHATLKHAGFDWNVLNWVIAGLLGIAAPVLAFIAGDVLGMFAVRDAQRQRAADQRYTDALRTWHDGLTASWNAQKSRMGIRVEVEERPALSDRLSEQTDSRQTARTAFGYSRTPDGQKQVAEYLDAHPEAVSLSVRKLGELVGVGHDTAAKGKKAWQSANQ